MDDLRKFTKVTKICDGITTRLKLKGYAIFEDNWIGKHDKVLYNQADEPFNVLDFQEIEENTLVNPSIMPHYDGWAIRKHSCVKFNTPVKIGDIFYIK